MRSIIIIFFFFFLSGAAGPRAPPRPPSEGGGVQSPPRSQKAKTKQKQSKLPFSCAKSNRPALKWTEKKE
jgi:hypothetical protein